MVLLLSRPLGQPQLALFTIPTPSTAALSGGDRKQMCPEGTVQAAPTLALCGEDGWMDG